MVATERPYLADGETTIAEARERFEGGVRHG